MKYPKAGVWCVFLVVILQLSNISESRFNPVELTNSMNLKASQHSSTEMPNHWMVKNNAEDDPLKGLFATGSSLPDCSHACGPCFPCRRVMVSFKCSIAESCPIIYRCMCKGRYYHVPSN